MNIEYFAQKRPAVKMPVGLLFYKKGEKLR